jgi:BirA family biotin operon repressor/biotin-[acetyl-CoA-carboxylase] ligase
MVSASIAGVRLIAHESIGSTNAEALALARKGVRDTVWITARRQTAGRGRRGREWDSPPGNLYATLLLPNPCEPEIAPQLSFVAGLALHDAVLSNAPMLAARLTLKWPNDLLLDREKLAGILVEGERLDDGAFVAVVGIGVNCASHPDITPYPATNLARAGAPVLVDALLERLADAMTARLAQWRRAGFASVRNDWLARTWRVGEAIRLRTPEEVEGRFAGIDAHGRLLLGTGNDGVRTIAAGDIMPARAHMTGENAQ